MAFGDHAAPNPENEAQFFFNAEHSSIPHFYQSIVKPPSLLHLLWALLAQT